MPTRRQLTLVRLGGTAVLGTVGWLLLGPLWAFPCALTGLFVLPLVLLIVAEYRQPRPEGLLRAGRPADALKMLDRHMHTDRVLGERWPGHLARKLVLKSAALQALSRLPQALDAADEAVTLLAGKGARRPGAVHASAFCQRGLVLAAMSRHGEALNAVEAAVRLYRDLAIGDRNSFLPPLAEALTHQADALGFLDRFEEARVASAEALLIRSDMLPAGAHP
jgi:tetratricopeptide (TPR) repeat protein